MKEKRFKRVVEYPEDWFSSLIINLSVIFITVFITYSFIINEHIGKLNLFFITPLIYIIILVSISSISDLLKNIKVYWREIK